MTRHKPLLVVVVGPTAIGKTALALQIAEAFTTEIISADSRQFYREMSIGTAVPSADELATTPHHFIQNKSIFDVYTVGEFEREALLLLDQLFETHRTVVMAGGSGLYVDAVTKGLDTFPEVAPEIREELNAEFQASGIEVLQEDLQKADPEYYSKVDIQNPHRLIRALEIFRGSGHPYSSFLKKGAASRKFDTLFVGLSAPRKVIYDRINHRVDLMMKNGLEAEARHLHEHKDQNALQTVGYRELFRYFEGELSLEEAISEIKKNTRRFAKRQLTWFQKNEFIQWFDYETPPEEIIQYIKTKSAR